MVTSKQYVPDRCLLFNPFHYLNQSKMKAFKLTFLFLALFTIAACGDDDDDPIVCGQSDWVGTYEGTIDCDGTVEDVTLVITASGADNIVVVYTTASQTTEYDPLPFTECTLVNTASGGGVTANIDLALNGNTLTLDETISIDTTSTNCMATLTRN